MTLWWTADNLDLNDNISIKWQSSNTSELHLQCCSWLNVPGFTPPLGEIPLSEHACDASASIRWSCRMCLSDNTWHFKTLLPQYQSMNQVVCVEHCSSAVYKNRYVKWCAPLLTQDHQVAPHVWSGQFLCQMSFLTQPWRHLCLFSLVRWRWKIVLHAATQEKNDENCSKLWL